MTGRARTGQEWALSLVALVPVLLATLGFQEVIGPTGTALLLMPAAIGVALVTALLGRWVGFGAVLVAVVAAVVVPSSAPRWVLVASAAAVALASWASVAAIRSRRPALAIWPPAALVLVALVGGLAGSGGALLLVTGVTVAIALVLLTAGSWSGAGDGPTAATTPSLGAVTSSAVAMALVGVIGLAGGAVADTLISEPARVVTLEPSTPAPAVTVDVRDPLTEATKWQTLPDEADRDLMTLLPSVSPTVRTVWMSLMEYNGAGWRVPTFYRGVNGGTVPPYEPDEAEWSVAGVSRLQVGPGLPGPWIPVPQRVTQVIGSGVARVNLPSGTVINVSSPIGQQFEARYEVGAATERQLAVAKPGTTPGDPATVLPSALPPRMAALARSVASDAGDGAWSRLVALAERLHAEPFRTAPDRRLPAGGPGRSLEDLDRVLAVKVGFQEQYAAIFALVARAWGIPTRLCIGFLPTINAAGTPVRGRDTSIWAEARLDGIGWVAFQASPQDRVAGRPAVVTPPLPETPATSSPSPTSTATRPSSTATTTGDESVAASAAGRTSLVPLLVGVLVLLAWPLAVALRRRLRRRGLASGSEAERVAGAWMWARHTLAEAGLALPPGMSPDRVADSRDPVGDDLPSVVLEPLRALANTCSPVMYAPGVVSPGTGDVAWNQADAVAAACSSVLTPRRRIGRWLRWSAPPSGAAILSETVVGRAPRNS